MHKQISRTQFLFLLGIVTLIVGLGLAYAFFLHAPVNVSQKTEKISSDTTKITIKDNRTSTTLTRIGATYEQHGAEYLQDSSTKKNIETTISSSLALQNRHIIGFGATNIWTDPTNRNPKSWHWENLDKKVAEMRKSNGKNGAEITLTLGMAPNWMTTGNGLKSYDGKTLAPEYDSFQDYSDKNGDGKIDKYRDNPSIGADIQSIEEIEAAPDPWFEDDFAYMSAQVAKRYPDVKIFQVWNELKGMYDQKNNRWDYKRYTRLYNKVYKAVKSVRKDAKIGGPYLQLSVWSKENPGSNPTSRRECRGNWGILDDRDIGNQTDSSDSVYSYWLTHNIGADFMAVDFSTMPNKAPSPAYNDMQVNSIIHNVKKCLQSIKNRDGTTITDAKTVPLVVSEFYPVASMNASKADLAAASAVSLASTIEDGYSSVLLWGVMSKNCSIVSEQQTLLLFASPYQKECGNTAKRGTSSSLAPLLTQLKKHFSPGTRLVATSYNHTKLQVLASQSTALVINKLSVQQNISLDACKTITFAPKQVSFIDRKTCTVQSM